MKEPPPVSSALKRGCLLFALVNLHRTNYAPRLIQIHPDVRAAYLKVNV